MGLLGTSSHTLTLINWLINWLIDQIILPQNLTTTVYIEKSYYTVCENRGLFTSIIILLNDRDGYRLTQVYKQDPEFIPTQCA